MASLAERHRARFDQRHAWSYRSRVDLTGSSRRSDANLRPAWEQDVTTLLARPGGGARIQSPHRLTID